MSLAHRQKLYKKIDDWEEEVLCLLGTLLPFEDNVQDWADTRLQMLAGLRQKLTKLSRRLEDEIVPPLVEGLPEEDRYWIETELHGYFETSHKQLVRKYQKVVQDVLLWTQLGYLTFSEALRKGSNSLADMGAMGKIGNSSSRKYALRNLTETTIESMFAQDRIEQVLKARAEFVEASAHYGARPSHAGWQGGIFKVHGSTPQYPNLAVATGYGTPEGLGGYGCRHYIWDFVPGVTEPRAIVVDRVLNDRIFALQQKANRHNRKATQWARRAIVADAQYDVDEALHYKAQMRYHMEQMKLVKGIIAGAMPINSQRER